MPKFRNDMHHLDAIQTTVYNVGELQENCLHPLCGACVHVKYFELTERIAAALERLVAILEAK